MYKRRGEGERQLLFWEREKWSAVNSELRTVNCQGKIYLSACAGLIVVNGKWKVEMDRSVYGLFAGLKLFFIKRFWTRALIHPSIHSFIHSPIHSSIAFTVQPCNGENRERGDELPLTQLRTVLVLSVLCIRFSRGRTGRRSRSPSQRNGTSTSHSHSFQYIYI